MGRSVVVGFAALSLAWQVGSAQPRPAAPAWPATSPAGNWELPGRDYALTRFSPLSTINGTTVTGLKPVWTISTGLLRAHEGNPLVVGSVMFVHTPFPNAVYALDLAKPGAPILWRYTVPAAVARTVPPTACCDVGSRGLAYHPSGKVYVPLLHGDLAALDARSGKEIWRVRNAEGREGATMPAAPLVVKDLVMVGTGGAEFGVRGSLTAYEAHTGKLVWRAFHTGSDAEVLIDGEANSHYPSHRGATSGFRPGPACSGDRAAPPRRGGSRMIRNST